MLEAFNRAIANTLYMVPFHVQQLQLEEPKALILAAGACKAQKRDTDSELKYEREWISARRAALILTTDKLVCGSWRIPITTIENAQLLHIKPALARALVLKIATTDGSHYQFGLPYDPAWEKQEVLKFTSVGDGKTDFVKIKHSKFSIALRVILYLILLFVCYIWYIAPFLSAVLQRLR